MDSEPLVVVLLKVPFKVAVVIKNLASTVVGKALTVLVRVIIAMLGFLHFRKSVNQMLLSGVLKCSFLLMLIYMSSYPVYWGISTILLSDYPYLSIPLILAELITMLYLLKKSSNIIPYTEKENLKTQVYSGLKDLLALFATALILISIIGIARLIIPKNPDDYLKNCYRALKFAILNILLIPKLALLLIVPWRIYLFLKNYNEFNTGIGSILKELLYGILDIICAISILFVVIGLFEAKRMMNKYKKGFFTRKLCLILFITTIADWFFVIVALINVLTIFRAYAFYKDLYDEKGILKEKTELSKVILRTFVDLICLPHSSILYWFIVIAYYRQGNLKVSKWDAYSNSDKYRESTKECARESLLQLHDMMYCFLLILCLPFVHRSVKSINRLLKPRIVVTWQEIITDLFRNCVLDIPSFFLLILIISTIVRIPLMRRRKSIYQSKHIFFLCLDITGEVLKDLLVIPFLLVHILTPWRFYALYPKLKKAVNPKEQRKIIKADGLRPIEDYATIIFSLILILSMWRTVEIISIIVTHIRQVLSSEQLTSSLFRKVFRKFLELIIDIFMVFMILCIFVLLIEVHNFWRRMRTFYYLYKDRRGFQYKKYIESIWPKKQTPEPYNTSVRKINRNVFTNIASFLDVKSLTQVSQVNKKFKDYTNFQPVWKFQYENYWKQYVSASMINEIALGDDYKELVKRGFENFTKENSGLLLDEQERDYRMGARVIVLEEFVLSIFGFPHIVALPVKALCYVLAKINLDWYFANPRYPSLHFDIWFGDLRIDTLYHNAVTVYFI